MKSNEIYKRFLLKNNTNDTNEGANFLISHFVLLFNSEGIRWETERLAKGDDDSLNKLDRLLISDLEVPIVKKFSDSVHCQLPDNFFKHVSSYSLSDKGDCKGVKVFNFEKKALNLTEILADDFNTPQFDFQETPCIIINNQIKIYFSDFLIKKVYISYYKTPTQIDISGYTKIDGSISSDVDSELSDDNIEEILNRLVVEIKRQTKDAEGFQLSKERVQTEK